MTNKNPFTPKGDSDFKLTMPIKKSFERIDSDGVSHMYIAGLASGTGIDHHNERMSETAIQAFAKAVEEGMYLPNGELSLIPLRSGHRKEWDDILGYVTKAEVDSDNNLWIEAELDENSSTARDLFAKLNAPAKAKRPLQLGFSVGGRIKEAGYEFNTITKEKIRVIKDVLLREISVVGSPAYPTAYVEAFSKAFEGENWDEISEQVQESNMTKTDVQEQAEVIQTAAATEVTKDAAISEQADNVAKADETAATIVTEEVTKTEEVVATDPQTDLNAKIDELTKSLASLSEIVERLSNTTTAPVVEVAVEATAPVAEEVAVEKSLEDRVGDALNAALATFKTETITPLLSDLQAVKKSVEEIGSQPMDKSIAVNTAKETDDVFEKFKADAVASKNPIGAAIRAGIRE